MRTKKKSIKIKWACPVCKNQIEIYRYLAKNRKYCSNVCRGKNMPMETRKKISETNKRKNIVPPTRTGSIPSIQTRKRMSESQKAWYAKGNIRTKGMKLNLTEDGLARKIKATQEMRRRIAHSGKLTDIEQIIDNYLHQNEIVHEHEYPVGIKSIDFYLPNHQLFIEADSEYWHQDKNKDRAKDRYVRNLMPGIKIVRCAERDIKNGDWVNQIDWGKKRNV